MINPKHSTAKTHKANERPEKQSNKNKNQWHNDTKRSEKHEHQTVNTNRMPKPTTHSQHASTNEEKNKTTLFEGVQRKVFTTPP